MKHVFPIKKQEFITAARVEEITEQAYSVLQNTGILLSVSPRLAEAIAGKGFEIRNNRVLLGKDTMKRFLEQLRAESGELTAETNEKLGRVRLKGVMGSYAMQIWLPGAVRPEPFTTQSLTAATKFAAAASRYCGSFDAFAPGYPCDVPAALDSLIKYKISALYGEGELPNEPTSLISAEYMVEMAQVVGRPIRCLPVYTVSPLCLGGDSAEIVFAQREKLDSFYVFAMPSLGCTSPLSITMSLAMCLAEVLGSAYIMREVTGLKPYIKPNIFPFDFQTMNYAFGTAQKYNYECIAEDFLAQLLGTPVNYHSTNINSCCAVSGAQACMEKTALIVAGALRGATKFYCIGNLSLDEIFSPVELLLGAEAIAMAERLVFPPVPESAEGAAEYIAENLGEGFIGTDLTLDEQRSYMDYPKLVNRFNAASQESCGKKDMVRQAEELARQLYNTDVEPVIGETQRRELDALYARALAGL